MKFSFILLSSCAAGMTIAATGLWDCAISGRMVHLTDSQFYPFQRDDCNKWSAFVISHLQARKLMSHLKPDRRLEQLADGTESKKGRWIYPSSPQIANMAARNCSIGVFRSRQIPSLSFISHTWKNGVFSRCQSSRLLFVSADAAGKDNHILGLCQSPEAAQLEDSGSKPLTDTVICSQWPLLYFRNHIRYN